MGRVSPAAFKSAYLIHGDDHGRIAERRAALRARAERESGSNGVECFEGDHSTPDIVAGALAAMTFAIGRRFVIVDGFDLAGGGIVTETLERTDRETSADMRPVAAWERFARNGHKGAVVTFGPHAERSRLVSALERRFFNRGLRAIAVDESIAGDAAQAQVVVAALSTAGMVVLTDLADVVSADDLRGQLADSGAELLRVELAGGEGDCSVDLDQTTIEASVEKIAEELLPHLRQTWTVDADST